MRKERPVKGPIHEKPLESGEYEMARASLERGVPLAVETQRRLAARCDELEELLDAAACEDERTRFVEFHMGPMGKRFRVRPALVAGVVERGTDDLGTKPYDNTRLMMNRGFWEYDAQMEPDPDATPGTNRKVYAGPGHVIVNEKYDEVVAKLEAAGGGGG